MHGKLNMSNEYCDVLFEYCYIIVIYLLLFSHKLAKYCIVDRAVGLTVYIYSVVSNLLLFENGTITCNAIYIIIVYVQ